MNRLIFVQCIVSLDFVVSYVSSFGDATQFSVKWTFFFINLYFDVLSHSTVFLLMPSLTNFIFDMVSSLFASSFYGMFVTSYYTHPFIIMAHYI